MLLASSVTVRLGGKQVVEDVSLRVSPGEMVALCGPNGAGKSTLLTVLSGERAPTLGSVTWTGKALFDFEAIELARRRAKLSQESELTFGFRVSEVVAMGRFPHDTPRMDTEIVQGCLEQVGIAELAERSYPTLSGGEKQRVQLARVLAQLWSPLDEPKLLFLDEPTSALDLKHQEVALRIAQRLCRTERIAVVVVLHDLNLASAWSDRILLMKSGRLVRRGLPSQVLTASVLRQVYEVDVLCLPHPTTGRPIVISGSGGGVPLPMP